MEKSSIAPCYKYIVKNIKTEDERHAYALNYYANMDKQKVERKESDMHFLLNRTPESCGDPFSIGGVLFEHDDYLEQIKEFPGIETVTCSKYYKSVLGSGQENNLCLLCRYSKSYANNEYADECRVFKYLSESKERYNQIKEIAVPNIFRSVFDIADGINTPRPALVPFLHISYELLADNYVQFFNYDNIRERLLFLNGKITLVAIKNRNVLEMQQINSKAFLISWERVISDIESAPDANFDEICAIISRLDLAYCHKQKRNKKKQSVAKEPTVAEHEQAVVLNNSPETKAGDDVATQEQQDNVRTIPVDELTDDMIPESALRESARSEGGGDEDYPDIDIPFGDGPAAEYNDGYESDDSENMENGRDDASQSDNENSDDNSSVPDATVSSRQSDGSDGCKSVSVPSPSPAAKVSKTQFRLPDVKDENFIFKLSVSKKILTANALHYSDYESQAFGCIMKSQILPSEIVYDEKGYAYILMYIRPMHKFLYELIDKNVPKTLIASLMSNRIRKVCYQPYYMYSIFRLYEIRLKNVFSLATIDKVAHQDSMLCTFNDFFKVYGDSFDAEVLATGDEAFDKLLYNMQGYILIQALLDREVKGRDDFKYQRAVDEVLGTSFLRVINLQANDYLFDLDADGTVIYNTEVDFTARHSGFFVTYSIGIDDAPDVKRADLYMLSLVELSSKGRIYKYNIQLVTIASEAMVLFIGEDEYELVITILQKFFNRYALSRHLEKFELNVSHQRVYAKDSQPKRKNVMLPNTVEEALDLLVTADDKVEVADSRLVRRQKSDQKKRKSQTKKFNPD